MGHSTVRSKRKAKTKITKLKTGTKARREAQKLKTTKHVRVEDDIIRRGWDFSKSVTENFQLMGLCNNPNADIDMQRRRGPGAAAAAAAGADSAPVSQVIKELEEAAKKKRAYVQFSRQYEVNELAPMLLKHGFDFVAMAKDIKVNIWQLTPTQLKKKVERYLVTLRAMNMLPDDASMADVEKAAVGTLKDSAGGDE